MAARKNTRTQARRSGSNNRGGGISAPTVFVGGALIGAAVLFGAPRLLKEDGDNFLRPKPNADAQPSAPLASEQVVADGEAVVAKPGAEAKPADSAELGADEGTEFDFYTVLPNKEVEMSAAQQAALNRAQARRVEYAQAQERRKAEQAAALTAAGVDPAQAGVEVMPDMAAPAAPVAKPLPKPVSVAAPATRTTQTPATVKSAPAAKPLPKPVVVAATPKPAPVTATKPAAAVKERPVKAAATTAANAPKPKAKAVASYGRNPDVTMNAKGVAMVMPKASAAAAPAAKAKAPAAKVAAADANTKLLLQAGSFGDASQAERVKAKIAMLGLGARVESSTAGGKNVYRVRLGPYAENSPSLDYARRKLTGGGMTAMEIHVK